MKVCFQLKVLLIIFSSIELFNASKKKDLKIERMHMILFKFEKETCCYSDTNF